MVKSAEKADFLFDFEYNITMNNFVFIVMYFVAATIIICLEAVLTMRCLKDNNKTKRWLGFCALFASIVLISYSVTIFLDARTQYFLISIFSSIYFIAIDLTLFSFCNFTYGLTNVKFNRIHSILFKIGVPILVFDIISLALNPFTSHAVRYVVRDTFIANYHYEILPLYYFHLAVSYVMIIVFLSELVKKLFSVPLDYRKQYIYVIAGISFIVILNAFFLFFPFLRPYNFLDYSLFGYGIAMSIIYWAAYVYPEKGMMDTFRSHLLESINQGVILFDYEKKIIIWNSKCQEMFPNISFSKEMKMENFLEQAKMKVDLSEGDFTLQSYIRGKNELKPIRLDFSTLKNKNQESIGNILVFSDYQLDVDILTGFQSWEDFLKHPVHFMDCSVVVMDANGLGMINKKYGKNEGDQIILQLSKAMVDNFDTDTHFIRGMEAQLIAICTHPDEEKMNRTIQKIQSAVAHSFQYGIEFIYDGKSDILDAIDIATSSMREKKLLDENSKHSNLLNSLIKALEECDSDTESHVKRTRMLGQKLGDRIGLSDAQQSDLSLLCLLHDIGKIGIPLDILNKPGKLTESEWKVICSHVEKGYQIAMSSPELEGIAQMILHHHERWDGKGYPDGLSRETIPYLSRIISVVDAFDAMVNNRSYRNAMSKKEAMEELRRCAGTQFDPSIVAEFLAMIETIEIDEASVLEDGKTSIYLNSKADKDEDYISSAIQNVDYVHYISFLDHRIYAVDDSFYDLTGYTKEEAVHILQTDLIPEKDREEYIITIAKQLYTKPIVFFEHRLQRKDGTILNVFCSGRRYYDSSLRQEMVDIIVFDSAKTYSVKHARAIESTKHENQLEHWENKYRRDSLTGLLNHESFKNDLEEILLKNQKSVMMLMIDVDHFKEFNDSKGHHAGDEFLIQLAQCIEQKLRKNDLACRMGGDEYACALLFPKKVSKERMIERSREIFADISKSIEEMYPGTTISMGVCIAKDENDTFNELYKKADKQLYNSKKNGRARVS